MSRSILPPSVQIPKPLLYYRFDDDSTAGNTVRDVVNGKHGSISDPALVVRSRQTKYGQGMSMAGSTGVTPVVVPDDPIMTPHVGLTGKSTWHFLMSESTHGGPMFNKDFAGGQREFAIYGAYNNIVVEFPGPAAFWNVGGVPELANGGDFIATVVFDATAPTTAEMITVYVNGVERPTTFSIGGVWAGISSTTAPVEFARRSVDSGYWNGTMVEAVWFPTAFTPEQVKELTSRSLRGLPAFDAPPVTDYSIWWSARDVDGQGNASLSTNPVVTTMVDHGSAAADATQAVASARPVLVPSRNTVKSLLNSHRGHIPGVRFDGVDDVLDFPLQSFTDFTLFALVRPDADVVAEGPVQVLLGRDTLTTPYSNVSFGSASTVPNELISLTGANPAVYATGTSNPNLVLSASSVNVVVIRLDGVRSTIRHNGVDVLLADSTSGPADATASKSLANINQLGASALGFSALTMFDLFIFPRALSDAEIIEMEYFFAQLPGVEGDMLGFGSNP